MDRGMLRARSVSPLNCSHHGTWTDLSHQVVHLVLAAGALHSIALDAIPQASGTHWYACMKVMSWETQNLYPKLTTTPKLYCSINALCLIGTYSRTMHSCLMSVPNACLSHKLLQKLVGNHCNAGTTTVISCYRAILSKMQHWLHLNNSLNLYTARETKLIPRRETAPLHCFITHSFGFCTSATACWLSGWQRWKHVPQQTLIHWL